jgi:hypothetical protein
MRKFAAPTHVGVAETFIVMGLISLLRRRARLLLPGDHQHVPRRLRYRARLSQDMFGTRHVGAICGPSCSGRKKNGTQARLRSGPPERAAFYFSGAPADAIQDIDYKRESSATGKVFRCPVVPCVILSISI